MIRRAAAPRLGWCSKCVLPVAGWTALILMVATRPAASLVHEDVTTALGVSRDLLQYPYHVGAFFILAILLLRCVGESRLPTTRRIVLTVLGALTVSAASELLQAWTPTRAPEARDLVLDLAGAAVGIGVMRLTGWRGVSHC